VDCILEHERLDLIRELDPDGSAGLLSRMVDAYADQAPRQVSGILEAAAESDFETVAGLAHTLKSASINLGAAEIHARAKRLEAAAREKSAERIAPELEGLEQELHKALGALKSLES